MASQCGAFATKFLQWHSSVGLFQLSFSSDVPVYPASIRWVAQWYPSVHWVNQWHSSGIPMYTGPVSVHWLFYAYTIYIYICCYHIAWSFLHIEAGGNGRHFPDVIFKCIFCSQNVYVSITISLNFVPMISVNNIPVFVHIMAWCRPGDKPLSEPMMVLFTDAFMRHAASTS